MKAIRVSMLLIATCALAGCAYHPQPVTVFGKSGAQFTAPTLCAALIQCQNSSEAGCYYDSSTVVLDTASGTQTQTTACKEVKK
jgi:hypothetical protein